MRKMVMVGMDDKCDSKNEEGSVQQNLQAGKLAWEECFYLVTERRLS